MRENRTSGSEGGGTGNLTGPSYPIERSAYSCVASHFTCPVQSYCTGVCDVVFN